MKMHVFSDSNAPGKFNSQRNCRWEEAVGDLKKSMVFHNFSMIFLENTFFGLSRPVETSTRS